MQTRTVRRALLFMGLIVVAGCGADDPVPRRLKARLEAVFDGAKKKPEPDDVREALVRQLRVAPLPSEGQTASGNAPFPSKETIDTFYASHAHRLMWSDGSGKIVPATTTLLETLRRAGDHGLNPEDYALNRLDTLEKEIRKGAGDERAASRLADFDLLLTTAFFRYAADVATGRLHPDEVAREWHTNPPELDFAKALDEALAQDGLPKLLEALPPPHEGYARLHQSLGRLRAIEAAGGWPAIPPGPKLGAGSRGPRVAMVRQRLEENVTGGARQVTATAPAERFDPVLTTSVKHFQSLHGIEPDGVVSDETLAELNVPAKERIRQVELNLERWRWIPRKLGDPHVTVNIPGFDLELNRGGASAWRTRVVAGKAFTPTPVFSDRIVALVVNPPWNVPDSIAMNEYLPELRKSPDALSKKGLLILEGSGDKTTEVDPRKVDWDSVEGDHFPYRIRQEPGPENPLGRLKFDLTNDFHIYLHDTPGRAAFGKTDRDLSHGCIRVQNALELANQIAGAAAQEKISQALEQPEERRVELDAKIPVHIMYWTAWADEGGNLHYGPDVYGFDKTQRTALDRVAGRAATNPSPVTAAPFSGAKTISGT